MLSLVYSHLELGLAYLLSSSLYNDSKLSLYLSTKESYLFNFKYSSIFNSKSC